MTISKEDMERLTIKLLNSDNIRKLYDMYIIKTISFEKWINDCVEHFFQINTKQ